jgi:hypothetical protein
MNPESKSTVQDMIIEPNRKRIEKATSLKKRREALSNTLLKAQGIRHGDKCYRCGLNCEVKRQEHVDFSKIFKEPPIYSLDNCPKQGKLSKLRIKKKNRER